ncbi:MAG: hypothetical protein LRZ98_01865 [Candidatus Pacebacteria bacterium]|nr:hypothetical protein [Candidatus Paceibacterota bacterium]
MIKEINKENDIERLTNQQIILLVILVAVVSSITAAIVVIRFYERNPNIVTRIIHDSEVIEQQTIKKKPEIQAERTIIIQESDLIAKAVTKNSKFVFDVMVKRQNIINTESKENLENLEKVSSGFKKNGKIFTQAFNFDDGDKIFANLIELEKIGEKSNIFIFKEKGNTNQLIEIYSEIGKVRLGTTVVNIFSNKVIEKGSIIKKINKNEFISDLNIEKIGLAIGISGKVFGISINNKIYTFQYFNE